MTATVTREITISYASLSIGGTTDYLIDRSEIPLYATPKP